MKTTMARLKTAVALACLIGAAAPALADTTDDLLLTLKNKGILTEAEYQQLLQRKAAEPVAVAPAQAPLAPQGGQTQQTALASGLDDKRIVRMTDKGVGMQIGDVALTFSGSVNGFYTHDSGDSLIGNHVVSGGLASVGGKSSSVRNGLLPGFLLIDVTTNQGGWDIGAHFGMYPGINSVNGPGGANSAGTPQALATAGIDFRKTYLTFGKPNIGEFKVGRDIGLFGSDAILNDITLLSIGSTGGNAGPSNTSLGRIGIGYIYTDFQPQITYTSPKFAGFQASFGVFQPLTTVGRNEVNKDPGFQGKITYDYKADRFGAHAWLGGIVQKHDSTDLLPGYTGRGFDVGAKLSFGPATLTGYYYDGSGLGTTGLFILSTDALGNRRRSDGYYAQATYTFGKFMVAGSYGASFLKLSGAEKDDRDAGGLTIYDPTLVDRNASWVGQGRYGLTSWVTLLGEYVHTHSTAQGGNHADSNTIATGAILFF
ncbi:MAG TPA: porin [Sphingomonas sp.]